MKTILFLSLTLFLWSCGGETNKELDFILHMIPHHQEAVDSSQELLTLNTSPEIEELLVNIISDQKAEIALMNSWLRDWYPGESGDGNYQPMMRSLEGLDVNQGEIFFLQDMIHHHEMAVSQAHNLLESGYPLKEEVKTLAMNIIRSQEEEISWMRNQLGDLAPEPKNPEMDHSMH